MITRTTNVYHDSWKETFHVEKITYVVSQKVGLHHYCLQWRNVLHLQCDVVLWYLLILLLVQIFVFRWNAICFCFDAILFYTRLLLSLFSVSRSLLLFPLFCCFTRTVELTLLLHVFVVILRCCFLWFRTIFMQLLFDSRFVFLWLCCTACFCVVAFLISFVPLPKLWWLVSNVMQSKKSFCAVLLYFEPK